MLKKKIICTSLTGTLGDNGRMVGCCHGNSCPISLTWPQFWYISIGYHPRLPPSHSPFLTLLHPHWSPTSSFKAPGRVQSQGLRLAVPSCLEGFSSRHLTRLFPPSSLFFFFFLNSSYFWLLWVFVAVPWLSLAAAGRGSSWLRCVGFSQQWLLLLPSTGSRHAGSVVAAAPRHVGFSRSRDQIRVPYIGNS